MHNMAVRTLFLKIRAVVEPIVLVSNDGLIGERRMTVLQPPVLHFATQ